MSGYKFHIFFGFFTSLLLLLIMDSTIYFDFMHLSFLIPWFIITIIFSIIPDIDSRTSMGSYILHILLFLTPVLMFSGIAPLDMTVPVIWVLLILEVYHIIFSRKGKRHRHWSHNILFGLVIAVFVSLISLEWTLGLFGFVSFLSHLAVDKYLPY